MSKRLWSMFAIGSSLVLATGCPTRTEPKQDPPPKIVEERAPKDDMPPPHEAPVGIQKVTLHIPQMAERQGLTGITGKNKVKEALSGLPGVQKSSIDVDLDEDKITLRYDAAKVNVAEMAQAVSKQGFEAKVVAGPSPVDGGTLMRKWLQSMLGGKAAEPVVPPAPTDVTLHVPGMYGSSGGPDRVRKALATLPWVEQGSVQTDVNAREVRFNLVDKAAFDEFVVQRALQAQNFHEMTVRAAPARMNGV